MDEQYFALDYSFITDKIKLMSFNPAFGAFEGNERAPGHSYTGTEVQGLSKGHMDPQCIETTMVAFTVKEAVSR